VPDVNPARIPPAHLPPERQASAVRRPGGRGAEREPPDVAAIGAGHVYVRCLQATTAGACERDPGGADRWVRRFRDTCVTDAHDSVTRTTGADSEGQRAQWDRPCS